MSNKIRIGIKYVVLPLAVLLSLFQLYTSAFGVLTPLLQRGFHITLVTMLIFLYYPINKYKRWRWIDYIFVILVAANGIYMFLNIDSLLYRVGNPNILDVTFSIILTLLLLEATRRVTGWILPIIISVFLFYMLFGEFAPGVLKTAGMSINRIISLLYLSTEGIFGEPLAVAATVIASFVLFGAFLEATGAGKIFIDLAFSIAGVFRGGPAKVATMASALTGTVSGSGVANTMTTGVLTIPVMKNSGYKSKTAGAIEAVASTGGTMMPPIMGSAAFIMSEITGIPYFKIMIAAIIPSVLYYVAVFFFVDFEAGRNNLLGLNKKELPRFKEVVLKGFHLYLGFGSLIFLLVFVKVTPVNAALWATVILIVSTLVFYPKTTKWTFIFDGLVKGAKSMLMISVACASAGIVVAAIKLTGIGEIMTNILVSIGQNSLFLSLIVAMIACIIMGMGLPANVSYIILGVLVPPALINLGVSTLVAHMFVFYYTSLATITPPVALAAYAGASIAKTNPISTSFESARIGLVGFLVPFMFVYAPELLALGSPIAIGIRIIISILGIILLAAFLTGWMRRELHWLERLLALSVSFSLIIPNNVIDIIGGAGLVVFALLIMLKKSKTSQLA